MKVLYLSCIKFCKIRMPVTKMTSSQRYIQKDTRRSFLKKEKRKRKKKEKRRIVTRRNYWTANDYQKKKNYFFLIYLEWNYTQVLQFQSKVLCQEKKKKWNEAWMNYCNIKKINSTKYENFQYAKIFLEMYRDWIKIEVYPLIIFHLKNIQLNIKKKE